MGLLRLPGLAEAADELLLAAVLVPRREGASLTLMLDTPSDASVNVGSASLACCLDMCSYHSGETRGNARARSPRLAIWEGD